VNDKIVSHSDKSNGLYFRTAVGGGFKPIHRTNPQGQCHRAMRGHHFKNQEHSDHANISNSESRPDKIAIVAVIGARVDHQRHVANEPTKDLVKAGGCPLRSLVSGLFKSQSTTRAWRALGSGKVDMDMIVHGPYNGEFAALERHLQHQQAHPPLLVVATGAGAGLILDTYSLVHHLGVVQGRVEMIYSTWSLPLCQYVANTCATARFDGLNVHIALTSKDSDLHVVEQAAYLRSAGRAASTGHIDFEAVVRNSAEGTEVFFCGGPAVHHVLSDACKKYNRSFYASVISL
jgi:hypothetical protein